MAKIPRVLGNCLMGFSRRIVHLPRLLELSREAQVILTGPSVSCCPALTELGIDRLNGRVITQPELMLQAIVEKRRSVNPWSETFQLDRLPLPAQDTETERC